MYWPNVSSAAMANLRSGRLQPAAPSLHQISAGRDDRLGERRAVEHLVAKHLQASEQRAERHLGAQRLDLVDLRGERQAVLRSRVDHPLGGAEPGRCAVW